MIGGCYKKVNVNCLNTTIKDMDNLLRGRVILKNLT